MHTNAAKVSMPARNRHERRMRQTCGKRVRNRMDITTLITLLTLAFTVPPRLVSRVRNKLVLRADRLELSSGLDPEESLGIAVSVVDETRGRTVRSTDRLLFKTP